MSKTFQVSGFFLPTFSTSSYAQDRTAKIGQPEHDCQDKTAKTGLSGENSQDRTERKELGQIGKDI